MGTVGAALLLWGPRPPALPAPSAVNTAAAAAAKQAAAQQATLAYHDKFVELLAQPSRLGSSQQALLLHSWGSFLSRWLSAAKAADMRQLSQADSNEGMAGWFPPLTKPQLDHLKSLRLSPARTDGAGRWIFFLVSLC